MRTELNKSREFILAFFSMFIFSVSNIYILNIAFFMFWIFSAMKSRGRLLLTDRKIFNYLILHMCWVIFDAVCVTAMRSYPFGMRNIIQLVFEIQYIIWALELDIDVRKYIEYLIKVAVVYSIILIIAFFLTGTFRHLDQIFGLYREWGEGIFPGNTTSAPIPFIFALFWALYYKKGYICASVITIGGLLFPSRVSLLAMLIVWGYFIYCRFSRESKVILWFLAGLFLLAVPSLLVVLQQYAPDLAYRLTLSWDRVDILKTVAFYFKQHWLLGYGGRTLNQLYDLIPFKTGTGALWPHTHNFVLEILLRYGLMGLMFFSAILVKEFRSIRDTKIKFIFMLFMIMALFQTYMREFTYVFFIYIMVYAGKRETLNDGI